VCDFISCFLLVCELGVCVYWCVSACDQVYGFFSSCGGVCWFGSGVVLEFICL